MWKVSLSSTLFRLIKTKNLAFMKFLRNKREQSCSFHFTDYNYAEDTLHYYIISIVHLLRQSNNFFYMKE